MSSYSDRNRYNTTRCNWGEIFGLSPKDLTTEQLLKINPKKLIELVLDDKRVERILANRLRDCPIEDVSSLKFLNKEEMQQLPILMEAYNDFVNYREKDIKKENKNRWSSCRNNCVIWDCLNDSNKAKEFHRFIRDEDNVVNIREIDFNWLCDKYEWLAHKVIDKMIAGVYRQKQTARDPVPRMIMSLPEKFLVYHLDGIFSKCGSQACSFVLSNPMTPEKYVIKGLRSIAGRIRVPNITMSISKKMLSALPSVKRLEALETLLVHTYSKITFEDIHKSEDLETLLFGTAIKYNDRVKAVVKYFKRRYERR